MATHHANPCELVDLESWTNDSPKEQTKAIVKIDEMELVRIILSTGKTILNHKVPGPITVYCLKGKI